MHDTCGLVALLAPLGSGPFAWGSVEWPPDRGPAVALLPRGALRQGAVHSPPPLSGLDLPIPAAVSRRLVRHRRLTRCVGGAAGVSLGTDATPSFMAAAAVERLSAASRTGWSDPVSASVESIWTAGARSVLLRVCRARSANCTAPPQVAGPGGQRSRHPRHSQPARTEGRSGLRCPQPLRRQSQDCTERIAWTAARAVPRPQRTA